MTLDDHYNLLELRIFSEFHVISQSWELGVNHGRRSGGGREGIDMSTPPPLKSCYVSCSNQFAVKVLYVLQESLANAKESARQQCVYEGP